MLEATCSELSVADLDNVRGGAVADAAGTCSNGMLTIAMSIGNVAIVLTATKDGVHKTTIIN